MNARQQCHNKQLFKEETLELARIQFVILDTTRVEQLGAIAVICNL